MGDGSKGWSVLRKVGLVFINLHCFINLKKCDEFDQWDGRNKCMYMCSGGWQDGACDCAGGGGDGDDGGAVMVLLLLVLVVMALLLLVVA
jgi:hypothetical protein